MFVSTKGRYGARLLIELARRYGEGPVPLHAVAAAQGLSEAYLEQLALCLRRAGFLETVRGAGGGCRLARPPEAISFGAALAALEGRVAPTECAVDGFDLARCCANPHVCFDRSVWVRVRRNVEAVVHGLSLAELAGDRSALADGPRLEG